MPTKTYHTMDRAEWQTMIDYFHPQYGSHYIDLPNGRILVATTFSHEGSEEHFIHGSKTVKSLPHPVFSGNDSIGGDHAEELHHLFDEHPTAEARKAAAALATTKDIAARAAKIHPLMRMSVF